jgi:type II secretory pathway pseudopilin PulG
MKKSFTIVEIIITILIISIILTLSTPKNTNSKLKYAKEQIIIHLKYTRYLAMLDNKFDHNNQKWFKKRWTLKFQNCRTEIGGVYYLIYSDKDASGYQPKKIETLKDPLTNKYIYSYYCEEDNLVDKLEQVKITEYFGVSKAEISCNDTSTIGQLSFGNDGNLYTYFDSIDSEAYKITEQCKIKLYDLDNQSEIINIEPSTGYIY